MFIKPKEKEKNIPTLHLFISGKINEIEFDKELIHYEIEVKVISTYSVVISCKSIDDCVRIRKLIVAKYAPLSVQYTIHKKIEEGDEFKDERVSLSLSLSLSHSLSFSLSLPLFLSFFLFLFFFLSLSLTYIYIAIVIHLNHSLYVVYVENNY